MELLPPGVELGRVVLCALVIACVLRMHFWNRCPVGVMRNMKTGPDKSRFGFMARLFVDGMY